MQSLGYYRKSLSKASVYLAATILLLACDKPEVIPSTVTLLTRHNWQLNAWTSSPAYPLYNANGTLFNTYNDLFEYWRNTDTTCPLDQHLSFSQGEAAQDYERGPYSFRQGTQTCGPRFINHSGSWYTDESSGKISLYLKENGRSVFNDIYTVQEISSDRLILSNRVQLAGRSTIYTHTYTFIPE